MLREEERKGEVEWGDRGILCVILQQKGVLSSKILSSKAGHQRPSDWVESYFISYRLNTFCEPALPPFFLPVNWR